MIKIKAKKKIKSSKKSPDVHQEILGLGVLIEHVDHNVQLVAEQYGDIKKDISGINKTLDSHTEILGSHTEILKSHSETLKSHTETLKSHTEMIGKLAVDMTIVKEDIAFIKGGLKKRVDIDEFMALERRVVLLEKCR
ncbi:MAG: hypothetical protein HY219_00865 [Candidatus Staskawiczbacteria bacterium]|nr:hypothetical protein [Candidatus Staskawiczbacteria bacterium]